MNKCNRYLNVANHDCSHRFNRRCELYSHTHHSEKKNFKISNSGLHLDVIIAPSATFPTLVGVCGADRNNSEGTAQQKSSGRIKPNNMDSPMPTTTTALPKPSSHNSSDNDDEDDVVEMTVLEPSPAALLPHPGAVPVAGPDGRRRSTSDDSDVAETSRELEGPVHPRRGTVLRHDNDVDANNAEVLLEANLVTVPSSYIDHVPLVEGQAVIEQSAAERAREQRRRFVRMLALILLAVGIAVGVTLGITSNRSPPLPGTSIPNFRQLYDSLPNHTAASLRNTRSPQYLAWTWLATTELNFDADVWQLRQRFALACFHFSTTAFAPYITTGPFSPLDVGECLWNGTSCNKNGNVTHLVIPGSGLTGSMPRELYFLSDLSNLTLTHNALEGNLSPDVQLMSNLEALDVSHNSLGGSLPTELGLLSELTYLDISFNQFGGTIPTELIRLTNRTELGLSYNDLTGTIPTELGRLFRKASLAGDHQPPSRVPLILGVDVGTER